MVVLANHPNWQVYPEEIAKRKGVGRDTIDRHLKKLEDAGYMRVIKKASVEVEVFRLSDSSQM
ncbi:phage replication protein [Streptococcus pneumoniae]|nr:phage replication protein [Streptococcus pneumoniae]